MSKARSPRGVASMTMGTRAPVGWEDGDEPGPQAPAWRAALANAAGMRNVGADADAAALASPPARARRAATRLARRSMVCEREERRMGRALA